VNELIASLQFHTVAWIACFVAFGWMGIAICWLAVSKSTLQAEAKQTRLDVERQMVAAVREDEIRQERLVRENVRLAVLAKVMGCDPVASRSGEPCDVTLQDESAATPRSHDALFGDLLSTESRRTRSYTAKVEGNSPVALRARFRCVDKSPDLSSKRVTIVIDELNSGTRLIATNCRQRWHDDRWVFEAILPGVPALDLADIPREFRKRKSDWMKYFGPEDLPLTDRQLAVDELANWFLRLAEGREQPSSGGLAHSVDEWDHYMDPLPHYDGQRVYPRAMLEKPKV
jgi:hypothetical protein